MTSKTLLVVFLLAASLAQTVSAQPRTIDLRVDATEVPRKILHARMMIPVSAGPLRLLYPKWIPGEHGPTGPIVGMAGLKLTANGSPLEWRRDPLEMYAISTVIPPGVGTLTVDLDFLPPIASGQFTSGASTTAKLALISWNTLLLYPSGSKPDEIRYAVTLRLPSGWKHASALTLERQSDSGAEFAPVSLTTLIDSPILVGASMKKVTIAERPIRHEINIAADSEEALETPEDFVTTYRNLVDETGGLFGARHYRHYNWLLTLSDGVAHFGLEHHESSDNRMKERTLEKQDSRNDLAGLLSHEFVHSWNGKYRRPAGLMTTGLEQPFDTGLLWVYEGLTHYLGKLLVVRSGLWKPEFYRESLAATASSIDGQAGRTWRPLADTAVQAQVLFGAPKAWAAYRRGVDFYEEGVLVWLDTDMTIRRLTNGTRSLDDFCKRFYGGESGSPAVKPYTFDDIVATLNDVAPHDWRRFLQQRLSSLERSAPLGGIVESGWKVVYSDVPNEAVKAKEESNKNADLSGSLGLWVEESGVVIDVIPEMPAAKSGLAPGVKIVAVNGRRFSADNIRGAVKRSKTASGPITLIIENGEFFTTQTIDYHDGLRYPHLERVEGRPDRLAVLIKPLRETK